MYKTYCVYCIFRLCIIQEGNTCHCHTLNLNTDLIFMFQKLAYLDTCICVNSQNDMNNCFISNIHNTNDETAIIKYSSVFNSI